MRKPAAQPRLPFDVDIDIATLRQTIATLRQTIADVEAQQQKYIIGPDWRRYQAELLRLGDRLAPLVRQRAMEEESRDAVTDA